MRVVVQRSASSSVAVENKIVGKIKHGVVLLIGFTEGDNKEKIEYLAKKIVTLRIFPDENDIMNHSLIDTKGEILAISQFTLYADTKKGARPSYMKALKSEEAEKLYKEFCQELEKYTKVERGVFGSDMEVTITNVGPTTILLER